MTDKTRVTLPPLPQVMVEAAVRAALIEDLGRGGDLTTDSVIPVGLRTEGIVRARQPGCVAGADLVRAAFRLIDPEVEVELRHRDGERVEAGDTIATVIGEARSILMGERVALNYLGHLSGIATATAGIVDAIAAAQGRTRVACTRKTTPGLRAMEKHAVRAGGGINHRFGLDDGVLIKDNHIALAGGIREAVERARERVGHMVKIEVEVDTIAQLEEAISIGVDAVLLDNMGPTDIGGRGRFRCRACGDRGVRRRHAGNRARSGRNGCRSGLGRLADPQRPGAGCRA